jgi:hypothetical protein
MPDALEHLALAVGVLDLLHLDDALLVEHLDGVVARVVARADEVDAAEGARPERLDEVEVDERVAGRRLAQGRGAREGGGGRHGRGRAGWLRHHVLAADVGRWLSLLAMRLRLICWMRYGRR